MEKKIKELICETEAHKAENILASFLLAESGLGVKAEALIHAYAVTSGSIIELVDGDPGLEIVMDLPTTDECHAVITMVERLVKIAYEWGMADAKSMTTPAGCSFPVTFSVSAE